LETQGYATQSFIIPACSVEAPHRRDRIWILGKFMGDTSSDGRIEGESSEEEGGAIRRSEEGRMLESEGASNMENPGRALRQGRIEQGENADEVRQGDADQLERSSGTSRSDVAHATSEGLEGRISGDNQGGQEWQALSRSEEQQHQVGADTRCSSEVSTKEDVSDSGRKGLQGHRGEHGLREASQEEQTGRSSQEQDVSHAKELDRNVDDNGLSGEDDGQQRQGLQGEFGGASGNRAEDVADTERLGQQGQGEHERPSNTAKASEGQASGTDDGSQGQTWQGHIEPGVGGMADGVSARLDGHYGFEREPNIPRVATGIPERVNRLKALGNSIVPQVIYNIGLAILEEEKRNERTL